MHIHSVKHGRFWFFPQERPEEAEGKTKTETVCFVIRFKRGLAADVSCVPIPHKYGTPHFLTYIVITSNKRYCGAPTQINLQLHGNSRVFSCFLRQRILFFWKKYYNPPAHSWWCFKARFRNTSLHQLMHSQSLFLKAVVLQALLVT